MTSATRAALADIMRADPDGGEIEPTPDAYRRHEAWARATYGAKTWERYRAGPWVFPDV